LHGSASARSDRPSRGRGARRPAGAGGDGPHRADRGAAVVGGQRLAAGRTGGRARRACATPTDAVGNALRGVPVSRNATEGVPYSAAPPWRSAPHRNATEGV